MHIQHIIYHIAWDVSHSTIPSQESTEKQTDAF